jgi:hypothetical protein
MTLLHNTGIVPLLGAEPHYFLLDQKVTKNQVTRDASLPHKAFALQSRQNQGPGLLPPVVAQATASGKIPMPLPPHSPTCFTGFRPKLPV